MYLNRFIEKDLLKWKNESNKVLLLSGARQTGKTTVLRHFADEHFENVIYIDVSKPLGKSLEQFYADKCSQNDCYNTFLSDFCIEHDIKFTNDNSTVLILDEIQDSKLLYEAIRVFNREYCCKVIVTGSYLGRISNYFQSVGDIERLIMYPISYLEFLSYFNAYKYLRNNYRDLGDKYEFYKKTYNVYVQLGGYPDIICEYLSNSNTITADRLKVLKSNIIQLLLEEIQVRTDLQDRSKVEAVLNSMVAMMAREKQGSRRGVEQLSKITEHVSDLRVSTIECNNTLSWLKTSGFISLVDKYDFETGFEYPQERIYFCDIGILTYFLDQSNLDDATKSGILSENFVYCNLQNKEFEGVFRNKLKFGVKGNSEIDFVCTSNWDRNIYGIEVKTGRNKGNTINSLLQSKDIDFAVYFKGDSEYGITGNVVTVPLFAAGVYEFNEGEKVEEHIIESLTAFE